MSPNPTTVQALAKLIAAREELRAELQLLAREACERWQEIDAKLAALEERIDHPEESGSGTWLAALREAEDSRRDSA